MFDSIVCNFVFEHVARPFQAITVIVSMLRPRGLLFWCAPFNERFHLVPGDFYRYTVMGAQQLVREAGLSVLHTQRWGNSMITSGYMMGFGAGDFSPHYLEKHMLAEVGRNVKWLDKKATLSVPRRGHRGAEAGLTPRMRLISQRKLPPTVTLCTDPSQVGSQEESHV